MSDYPDDYASPQFKELGVWRVASGSTHFALAAFRPVFTITGKGEIRGGLIEIHSSTLVVTDAFTLQIDGENLNSHILSDFKNLALYPGSGALMWCNCYAGTGNMYSFGLASGMTFMTSFSLMFEPTDAADRDVDYDVSYSLIV